MIRGVVYDQLGKPLSDCDVRLFASETLQSGQTVWNLASTVCTNSTGHYVLEIPSGRKKKYHIEVAKKKRKNCINY